MGHTGVRVQPGRWSPAAERPVRVLTRSCTGVVSLTRVPRFPSPQSRLSTRAVSGAESKTGGAMRRMLERISPVLLVSVMAGGFVVMSSLPATAEMPNDRSNLHEERPIAAHATSSRCHPSGSASINRADLHRRRRTRSVPVVAPPVVEAEPPAPPAAADLTSRADGRLRRRRRLLPRVHPGARVRHLRRLRSREQRWRLPRCVPVPADHLGRRGRRCRLRRVRRACPRTRSRPRSRTPRPRTCTRSRATSPWGGRC